MLGERCWCSGTVSGCTRLRGWFCTSELGMCNQQELLKWGGSSWSSVQRQSRSWVGLHGTCCSLASVSLPGVLQP